MGLSNVKRIEKLNKQIINNQIKDNIMKEMLDTLVKVVGWPEEIFSSHNER